MLRYWSINTLLFQRPRTYQWCGVLTVKSSWPTSMEKHQQPLLLINLPHWKYPHKWVKHALIIQFYVIMIITCRSEQTQPKVEWMYSVWIQGSIILHSCFSWAAHIVRYIAALLTPQVWVYCEKARRPKMYSCPTMCLMLHVWGGHWYKNTEDTCLD